MDLMVKIIRSSILPGRLFTRSLCSHNSTNTGENSNHSNAEKKLVDILKERFPNSHEIQVVDVSGGCGAMYDVTVITPEFEGISIVKQHRLVTDALKEEI